MICSGEPISFSSTGAKISPTSTRNEPAMTPTVTAVCTTALMRERSPLPSARATTTFTPTPRPTNRLMSRLIREVVEVTAACAASPANLPTTTTSAALNSS